MSESRAGGKGHPPPPERPTSLPSDPSSHTRGGQLDTPGANSRANATPGPRSKGVRRKALGYRPKNPPGPTPPDVMWSKKGGRRVRCYPASATPVNVRLDAALRALSQPLLRPPNVSASTPPSTVRVQPRPCSPKPRGPTSPPSVGPTVSSPTSEVWGPNFQAPQRRGRWGWRGADERQCR